MVPFWHTYSHSITLWDGVRHMYPYRSYRCLFDALNCVFTRLSALGSIEIETIEEKGPFCSGTAGGCVGCGPCGRVGNVCGNFLHVLAPQCLAQVETSLSKRSPTHWDETVYVFITWKRWACHHYFMDSDSNEIWHWCWILARKIARVFDVKLCWDARFFSHFTFLSCQRC